MAVQVATLSTQMGEVIKDISTLSGDLSQHRQEHDRDEQRRKSGQRWLIGIIVTAITAINVPTIVIFLVSQH